MRVRVEQRAKRGEVAAVRSLRNIGMAEVIDDDDGGNAARKGRSSASRSALK